MDLINIDNYLRLDLVDMVLVLISTGLIVLIAKKYFWNIAQDYLEKRKQFIQSQLDDAVSKNQESEKFNLEAKNELASLKAQSNEMLSAAQENAKKEAALIISDAKEMATSIKEKAQSDIEKDKRQAMEQMKEEMSEIALLAASKVVEKELNDDLHRKYVKEFIEKAGEA